ncbi:MAG: hypothetical protein A2161_02955 [Candidatus Schekmanbacteria bacterium RBG_13_48_7]|uniref:DUF1257 domain-containing protein n=1 Tax=Candidatus Schekmanbacteria bacterium RBG_13_48_7 TaxID=1817878 RepID=A0A1F7S0I3_9BACT|nr:MAG: hypothetical protein A2161_02955 [Candidatus Schekmanbacteria bacterium RBG_13_48_7]
MSVIFLVTPVLAASWPVFCSAAGAAAASLGFKLLKNVNVTEQLKTIELEVENSNVLTDQVKADNELMFGKDDLKIRIYKDARGQCSIHVMGSGRSDEELRAEGTKLINKIKQQYAYQKVVQELKNRGFSITNEEISEQGRIKIQLRKFS